MKRLVALFLILIVFASSIYSSEVSPSLKYEYEPYREDEFASWAMELRRAEVIFFGSLALTLPLSVGVYSLIGSLGANLPQKESTAFLCQLAGAAGASLIITGADWILGRMGK